MTHRTSKKAITRQGKWKAIFIEKLARLGNVRVAARIAGVDRETAYQHRRKDEAFAKAWQIALQDAADVLEAEAWRRAVKGVARPTTIAGERELVREYSDTLLIFLLKGNKPKKFREHLRHEVTGKDGGAIETFTKIEVAELERSAREFDTFARQRMGAQVLPPNGN